MSLIRSFAVLFVILAAALPGAGAAQMALDTEYVRTEIIPESNGFVPGETQWFAILQEIRPGWHVFWTNPGDAGLPLDLTWSLPPGFEAGDIRHPVPQYIPVGPLASWAHEGTPVFLVPVLVPADLTIGAEIAVEIDATWQVCEEICVPEEGRFTFSLPVIEAGEKEGWREDIFNAARAKLPQPYSGDAAFARRGNEFVLELSPSDESDGGAVFFFPEPEGLIEPAGKQKASIDGGVMTLSMTPGFAQDYAGDTLRGVLTVSGDDGVRRGFDVMAAVTQPLSNPLQGNAPARLAGNANIALLLALAFFGGLILNIMPCVFPIIFIKAAALMQSAREDAATVRRHGLLYSGGVLATFLFIGGVLLALRAGGEQLGWGFHLQSPPVVALSAYVLLLVGLNLSGLFSVGEGLAGSGEALARKGGGLGAFFTGALAVIVAAPCIGPLLSAPMGAALLQPAAVGLLIFAVMAIGLASPYLALSFVPSLGRHLPRPGPWMSIFKQALAFPVFAAAAYFLWVFSEQSDGGGLAIVLTGGVLLGVAAWLFELSKGDGARALIMRGIAALAALAALAPITRLEAIDSVAVGESAAYGAFQAEPYSASVLENYRVAGTPVFIDFTAAWCVTCQFNKATVFSSKDLAAAFDREGVVFMAADWTVRDPEITAALQSFGASGVPLYVYFPPGGAAEVLPLPLTKRAVLEAISGR